MIHVDAWRAAYRGLLPDQVLDELSVGQREQFWRDVLGEEGKREGVRVLVAEEEGSVVGFCGVATPSQDDDAGEEVAGIGAIYVAPAHWRRGAGSQLMRAVLDQLRREGWGAVTLWVLAENRIARGFYSRLGFEPDGAELVEERLGKPQVRLRLELVP